MRRIPWPTLLHAAALCIAEGMGKFIAILALLALVLGTPYPLQCACLVLLGLAVAYVAHRVPIKQPPRET